MKLNEYELDPGRTVKALTVWQPWATLLCRKEKRWETRSWEPPEDVVGQEVAIHSARRWRDEQLEACQNDPAIRRALINCERLPSKHAEADRLLPTGRVLCIMRLDRVRPAQYLRDNAGALHRPRVNVNLGDYSEGRYGWRFEVEYVYDVPPPTRGQQRLWEWAVAPDSGLS